ncbi:hypothetical protein QT973_15320 [Microcoleus sp. Z1_A1]|uniref:hypothetical protein n=1 Tax=Microcoleus sp. Z1_A1 TaxID=3055428 RepID=UPI002FD6BFB7
MRIFSRFQPTLALSTGVSTPGGLCHKADKFSVGFRAIEFERNVRSDFWFMGDRLFGKRAIEFLVDGRSNLREMCDRAISCSPISD